MPKAQPSRNAPPEQLTREEADLVLRELTHRVLHGSRTGNLQQLAMRTAERTDSGTGLGYLTNKELLDAAEAWASADENSQNYAYVLVDAEQVMTDGTPADPLTLDRANKWLAKLVLLGEVTRRIVTDLSPVRLNETTEDVLTNLPRDIEIVDWLITAIRLEGARVAAMPEFAELGLRRISRPQADIVEPSPERSAPVPESSHAPAASELAELLTVTAATTLTEEEAASWSQAMLPRPGTTGTPQQRLLTWCELHLAPRIKQAGYEEAWRSRRSDGVWRAFQWMEQRWAASTDMGDLKFARTTVLSSYYPWHLNTLLQQTAPDLAAREAALFQYLGTDYPQWTAAALAPFVRKNFEAGFDQGVAERTSWLASLEPAAQLSLRSDLYHRDRIDPAKTVLKVLGSDTTRHRGLLLRARPPVATELPELVRLVDRYQSLGGDDRFRRLSEESPGSAHGGQSATTVEYAAGAAERTIRAGAAGSPSTPVAPVHAGAAVRQDVPKTSEARGSR